VLRKDELVVADARRAQGLAGVMGGATSEVSDSTTDVVLEVATWDPGTIRRAARRHGIRTDASHRFERLVDARTLQLAVDRGAALIAEVSGGQLCRGTVAAGRPLPTPTCVPMRPRRCAALLGIDIPIEEVVRHLEAVGVETGAIGRCGDEVLGTIPPWRPDLTREADLIEEVARLKGLSALPIYDRLPVAIRAPQPTEQRRRELAALLTGLGFFETVTFSFTTPREALLFMPGGLSPLRVDDERRAGEPILRPSVLTGLLSCRRANQHGHVHAEGGVRLFEAAQVFAQQGPSGPGSPTTIENTNLALLADVPAKGAKATTAELQSGVRLVRGVIESLVATLGGAGAELSFQAAPPHCPAFEPAAFARVALGGRPLGYLGLVAPECQASYDLAVPVVGAELNLPMLLSLAPTRGAMAMLPEFPGIERDISVLVAESVPWAAIAAAIPRQAPLEDAAFIGTFRSDKLGRGKKSVTLRLFFRDPKRTLRHDEVDAPVAGVVAALRAAVQAELRG
jgi:phenylalanyl-tRNA synthetase beta chain